MKNPPQIPVDTIWSLPQHVIERLSVDRRKSVSSDFFLCGVYCAVAVIFLLIFGVAALIRAEMSFAYVIFSFAIVTFVSYIGIGLSGHLFLANHLVVLLMASLCLFLFYSGGTEGTGPFFYFIFPAVALFLQGHNLGFASIIGLFILSLLLMSSEAFGFDPAQYSFVFVSRIFTVYIIVSILTYLFSFFKSQAERELMLSHEDIEELSYTDRLTGLAKRNLMDKLLATEFIRYTRYRSPFCFMLVEIDDFQPLSRQYGRLFSESILVEVAEIFRGILRHQDIPCRWGNEEFAFLLSETNEEGALILAERLRDAVAKHDFKFSFSTIKTTISIGVTQIENEEVSELIHKADVNLHLAMKKNGNCVVNSH